MTMLDLLSDCVIRARRLPARLDTSRYDDGLAYCDGLLADLDRVLTHCAEAIRCGESMDLVVSQILQLKWLVYCALRNTLIGAGWSATALAAYDHSARCDLRESRDRIACAQAVPSYAFAG